MLEIAPDAHQVCKFQKFPGGQGGHAPRPPLTSGSLQVTLNFQLAAVHGSR